MKRRKKYRRIIKDKYKQIKFIGNTIENVVEELMVNLYIHYLMVINYILIPQQ